MAETVEPTGKMESLNIQYGILLLIPNVMQQHITNQRTEEVTSKQTVLPVKLDEEQNREHNYDESLLQVKSSPLLLTTDDLKTGDVVVKEEIENNHEQIAQNTIFDEDVDMNQETEELTDRQNVLPIELEDEQNCKNNDDPLSSAKLSPFLCALDDLKKEEVDVKEEIESMQEQIAQNVISNDDIDVKFNDLKQKESELEASHCSKRTEQNPEDVNSQCLVDSKLRSSKSADFQCTVCKLSFFDKSALDMHCLVHQSKKRYKCGICDKLFLYPFQLKRHVLIHNGDRPFKCEICGGSYTQNAHLTKHLKLHSSLKPHKCDECGKCYALISLLNRHLRKHKNRYNCSSCENSFSSRERLNDHLLSFHSHKECGKCRQTFDSSCDIDEHVNSCKLFKCRICDESFARESDLTRHFSSVHNGERPFKCKVCGKTFIQFSHLNEHLQIHTGIKRYKCDICGTCLNKKSRLDAHLLRHSNAISYTCSQCNNSFDSRGDFNRHLCVLTEEKPKGTFKGKNNVLKTPSVYRRVLRCHICNESFQGDANLKNHFSSFHKGERPHKCNVCKMTFGLYRQLKKHLVLHPDDTLHKCDICGDYFTNTSDLNVHLTEHNVPKPYCCGQCDESFASIELLNNHLLTHDEERTEGSHHECNECGRVFKLKHGLRKHSAHCKKTLSKCSISPTHSKERTEIPRHICNECGKAFTTTKDLGRHQFHCKKKLYKCRICKDSFSQRATLLTHFSCVHPGEKPYKCEICGSSFSYKSNYGAHLSKHSDK